LDFLAERFGSGDGERKKVLTREIAFEPLPASVLLNEFAALKRFAIVGALAVFT
jgi:hypothetical protein